MKIFLQLIIEFVAVPGFGKSKSAHFDDRRDFVEQFMKEVKLDRPVLICASMSGSYALPFVLRPQAATCTQRLRGFVPIAPVGTSEFSQADYSSCKVTKNVLPGGGLNSYPAVLNKWLESSYI